MTTVTPREPYSSGINLLGLAIWREARGEPYEAKLGVGWVIRNRCEMSPAEGFKPTADEEILRKWQFSSFNSDDPNSDKYPEPGPTWDDCLKAAAESSDPANRIPPAAFYRAVFYYSHPLTSPPHAWGNVMETQTVGNLHFCAFTDPRAPAIMFNMIFLKYLPFILQAIFAVQAAVPTLKGETKKQIATTLVTLAAGIVGAAPDAHVAAIGSVIDGVIPSLQAAGVLTKDQVPAGGAV